MKKNLWENIAGIIGIVLTVIFAIIVANDIFNFISSVYLSIILNEVIYYGCMALVIMSTLKLIKNAHIAIKIVLIVLWVIIFIFSVSPTLFGLIV